MDKKIKYYIKKSLELWFWIERLEGKYHDIPEKYDKYLVSKVKAIQPYLDEIKSDFDDNMLLRIIDRNLFLIGSDDFKPRRRRSHRAYDTVKSVVHNEILRPLNYDPMIVTASYKRKVDKIRK